MLATGGLALVTGASSGIGRAIAISLATRGLRVLLNGRDEGRLHATKELAGSNTTVLAADLTTPTGRAFVAEQSRPALDVLIHSAGLYAQFPVSSLPDARWEALQAVNLHAPMLLTAACLPQLGAASGQIVFINSSAALSASQDLSAYAASKRGLLAATDALRREINHTGIRVISVFPGRTDTPMQDAILTQERRSAPPGTLMQPEDVAAIVLACLDLPRTAEVTDIMMRPMRKL